MAEQAHPSLRRDLGPWSAASIVVGTIIGSGIFLVPATMIRHVGSPGMLYFVWIFGGLLSLAGALTYAELAAAMPEAGGEYVYLREAYGPLWGFIYSWTYTWIGKSGSAAAIATGFVYYLAHFLPALNDTLASIGLPIGPGGEPLEITYGQILAAAMLALLAVINHYGVKLGGAVQVAFTGAKVLLILAIVAVGLLLGGHGASSAPAVQTSGGVTGFFAALVAALWAFDGWNNLTMVSSEIRDPQRNLPRALIAGTAGVLVVYLLANLAYFHVLAPQEVASTDRVAATMMGALLGPLGGAAVSIAAMVSMFGALNGCLLSGARVPYAAARDGLFFRRMAYVHPRHRAPSAGILLIGGWAAVLVFSGRYEQLFGLVIFAEWLLYGMSAASVIVLRRKQPGMTRPYRTPGYPVVPVLFVAVAAMLVASTLTTSFRESVLGLVLISIGLPFYFRRKVKSLL